jgi:hypothetical protein
MAGIGIGIGIGAGAGCPAAGIVQVTASTLSPPSGPGPQNDAPSRQQLRQDTTLYID